MVAPTVTADFPALDFEGVLRAHRLPLTVSAAVDFLEAFRGSVVLLELYRHYFPQEYRASSARRYVVEPEVYSPAEVEFFQLVDARMFPLAYWFMDAVIEGWQGEMGGADEMVEWGGLEGRDPMVPVYPIGYDYEEVSLPTAGERFLAVMCGFAHEGWRVMDLDIEADFPEHVVEALDECPRLQAAYQFRQLERACLALPEGARLRELPLFVRAMEHFTKNVWWDAAYDMSLGPAIETVWSIEGLDWLQEEWEGALDIRDRLATLFSWIEASEEHQVKAISAFKDAMAHAALAEGEEGAEEEHDDD